MRSDDEKRVIAATILKRIESMPRVSAATAPVFCLDRSRKPCFLASAVLLKIKDWHFALTAGHVIDDRSFSDLYIGSGDNVVLLEGTFGTTVPPGNGNRNQDRIDIGIVRLSDLTVRDMREDEFLTLDDTYILSTATSTGHYVFAGYPRSKHKRSIKGGEAEERLYSFVVAPAPLVDYQNAGLNPCISLLLQFDQKKLWGASDRVVGPDPKGISGGGVWFVDDVFLTTPLEPLLVGVAVEKSKPSKPKRVLATKLHVALSAIWVRFPELRPYLPEPPHERQSN